MKSNPINIPLKNTFTFGKHKGKSYDTVFETDKNYVVWVLSADPKYYNKIQAYFRTIIETNK